MNASQLWVLFIVVTGGCTFAALPRTGGGGMATEASGFGLRPGDTTGYRRDLSRKMAMLENFNADVAARSQNEKSAFRRWTATGLVVGLAGGVVGTVVEDKETAARIAAVGSAVTGAISGWIGVRKYESEAARAEKCRLARESSIRLFASTWTPENVPATSEEVNAYQEANAKAHQSITSGCAV